MLQNKRFAWAEVLVLIDGRILNSCKYYYEPDYTVNFIKEGRWFRQERARKEIQYLQSGGNC